MTPRTSWISWTAQAQVEAELDDGLLSRCKLVHDAAKNGGVDVDLGVLVPASAPGRVASR